MLLFWGARSIDPDALAWAAAVTANSGTYSQSTLAAVSNFAKSAKSAGYWSKLNRINLFCGDQLAAAMVPLKVGGGSATETNVNFVGGDYTEATGLTGNGTTKYLRTGLVPSASLALNDLHMAVYNRAAALAGGNLTLGCRDGTNFCELYAPNSAASNNFGWRVHGVVEITGTVSAPFGFMVGSTISGADSKTYENGAQISTGSPSAGALLAIEVYVFGSNSSGSLVFPTSHPLAGYSIGSGLTAGDVTAYTTHMEAFQDALGRGVA